MPLNPCGWAVDYLRFGYTIPASFPGIPLPPGQSQNYMMWYRCDPNAPNLPWPTVYGSQIWNQAWDTYLAGELPPPGNKSRRWKGQGKPWPPGDRVCGTRDQYAGTEALTPLGAPNPAGRPPCCGKDAGGVVHHPVCDELPSVMVMRDPVNPHYWQGGGLFRIF